jgi:hypothetical protein
VRHIAAAPAVDIVSDKTVLFRSLINGKERKASLRFGTYPVEVRVAETATVAIARTSVTIRDKVNLVVYAWGAASKNNLGYLLHEVPTK